MEKINEKNESVIIDTKRQKYFILKTINEILKYKTVFPNANIINGATDIALRVTKNKEIIEEIIDISQVEELKEFKETELEQE